jgi:uncharacterized protein (TIGR00251 family)
MRITVSVQPNSAQEKAEIIAPHELKVWIKSKPLEGKANRALLTFLKSEIRKKTGTNPQLTIVSGGKSKNKILDADCGWETFEAAFSS